MKLIVPFDSFTILSFSMKNTAQKIDLLRPVFDKLNLVGFDDDYISNYGLPSWWDEELNFTVSGAMEGIAIIADRFNIKL